MNREDKYKINDLSELDKFKTLNLEIIKSILDLDDQEFTENLIKQYLIRAEKTIENIEFSIRKKKTTETYTFANDLRGSSLYIGTEKIIALSSFICDNSKKRNITPLHKASILLQEVFLESRGVLLELVEADKKTTN